MAQMERNVNLEEIESDAFLGIDALKGQTFIQKVVFFGTLFLGIFINVAFPLLFHTNKVVCILLFVLLLLVGIAIGCNYTEDMTYGKYLYCYFLKPKKYLRYHSTEDIKNIKENALRLKKEEEAELNRLRAMDETERKKRLMKVILIFLLLFLFLGMCFFIATTKNETIVHHTVSEEND